MAGLSHITAKIIALHEDGRTKEQITNLILSEHSQELGHSYYDLLYPIVGEIISSQETKQEGA